MSNTIKLNRDQARRLLVDAVLEKGPNFVYDRADNDNGACNYLEPDGVTPSCLIGNVATRAGLSPSRLIDFEGNGVNLLVRDEVIDLGDDTVLKEALSTAQISQDSGSSWGVALTRFDAVLAGVPTNVASLLGELNPFVRTDDLAAHIYLKPIGEAA